MSEIRIALLDASHGASHTPRNFRREVDASIAEFPVTEGRLPQSYSFDGVIVTGSRASVYWDEPWIEQTMTWVEDAIDRRLPMLGICWGHQLLAETLGGNVEAMGEYELGYGTIELTDAGEDDPLFQEMPSAFTSFITHSDAVVDLPPGGTPLARTSMSNHAFRKDNVVGVQFHPEYDMETAKSVTREKDDHLPDARIEAVLNDVTTENFERAKVAKQLFENFTQAIRHRQAPA